MSIALVHNGIVTQGVVYDPNRNDLFVASRGRGAFLNDRRIRVGKRDRLADALIGTGLSVPRSRGPRPLSQTVRRDDRVLRGPAPPGRRPRSISRTSPRGASTASSNKASTHGTSAAGSLLITEAGGLVGNYSGEADFLHLGEILAGNPKLYAQMIPVLGATARPGKPRNKSCAPVQTSG